MANTNAMTAIKTTVSLDASDADLIAESINGNENAFAIIMRRNNQRLFRTARSILRTDADAEEAVQEAYIKAWQALHTFKSDSMLSTWLVRITVNIQKSLTDDAKHQPAHIAMRSEIRTLLENHINNLPDLYRTVFVLRAIEELSSAEVANILQIPEATVRTRFARARGLLQKALTSDVDLALQDVFTFDGERCDRIVNNVLASVRDPAR